ncbi:hypothetical protein NDU88_003071 [Pleurodeles waltl]|uniref:Uncharacterized protein n=1 Tax=Pleurodeles waltl TaxID=8319 RepID=A0AAV7RBU8_PLEWA|nr:hypothetical protein NDU88_003071 [Pleurodeles waltl]
MSTDGCLSEELRKAVGLGPGVGALWGPNTPLTLMPEGGYGVLPWWGAGRTRDVTHDVHRAVHGVAARFPGPSRGLPLQLDRAEEAERSRAEPRRESNTTRLRQ